MFMIFSDTCFSNVFLSVLASILFPFLVSFRYQCWCFGVLVFNIRCWLSFECFCCDFATEMGRISRAVGSRTCGRPPTNHVSTPPSFQGSFFIDSAQLLDRFDDDFLIKCLYTCAVAEPRLAALKISIYIYIYIYICIIMLMFMDFYSIFVSSSKLSCRGPSGLVEN